MNETKPQAKGVGAHEAIDPPQEGRGGEEGGREGHEKQLPPLETHPIPSAEPAGNPGSLF